MNHQQLAGAWAVVTGAGRGIGRRIAVRLAAEGAGVVLAARSAAQLQQVADEIQTAGGTAHTMPTDVCEEAQIARLFEHVERSCGRLDVLVNNAGSGVFGPFRDTSTADWDRVMATNARGAFLMCRYALPLLGHRPDPVNRPAVIVNIASVVAVKGYVHQAAYAASKHAMLGMTKVLAREVAEAGIRVHAICPGGVDTELVRAARPDLDSAGLMQPDEIADIVHFLATRRGNAVIDQIDVRRLGSTPFA